jgi:hypothetical protein
MSSQTSLLQTLRDKAALTVVLNARVAAVQAKLPAGFTLTYDSRFSLAHEGERMFVSLDALERELGI